MEINNDNKENIDNKENNYKENNYKENNDNKENELNNIIKNTGLNDNNVDTEIKPDTNGNVVYVSICSCIFTCKLF